MNVVISDKAMLALKMLTKNHSIIHAALLERLILDEHNRVTEVITDDEYTIYRNSITV